MIEEFIKEEDGAPIIRKLGRKEGTRKENCER